MKKLLLIFAVVLLAGCFQLSNYNHGLKNGRLTKLDIARYWLCQNIYGPIMNAIQPGHYSK